MHKCYNPFNYNKILEHQTCTSVQSAIYASHAITYYLSIFTPLDVYAADGKTGKFNSLLHNYLLHARHSSGNGFVLLNPMATMANVLIKQHRKLNYEVFFLHNVKA